MVRDSYKLKWLNSLLITKYKSFQYIIFLNVFGMSFINKYRLY